jgi:hypothetical protein
MVSNCIAQNIEIPIIWGYEEQLLKGHKAVSAGNLLLSAILLPA